MRPARADRRAASSNAASFGRMLRCVLLLAGLWAGHSLAWAQTATVNALTNQSCAGTRASTNLGCTANDFSVGVNFTQPALTAIQSCLAGQVIAVDVITSLSSGSPVRYDAGIFFGEAGNDPGLNNAANTCSLGVFPTSPSPFISVDADVCGDFQSSSSATLQISQIRVLCTPAPGGNQVRVPYLVAWDNQASGSTCTTSNLTAGTSSKCVKSSTSSITGLVVQGFVRIAKATNPSSSTQSFAFSATASPAATVSPSSFSLSNGQSQTVTVPLSSTGGTQTLVIDETLVAGWDPNAVITCTSPTGGSAASYVTVDNANRRITAALTGTNYGAVCTYTNNRQTRVNTAKVVAPGAAGGVFNLSATSSLGSVSASNQTTGGATAFQAATGGTSVTVSETAGTATTLSDYVTTIDCRDVASGAAVVPTSTSLTNASTRSATLTPALYSDTTCTFTNTRTANVAITKSNAASAVVAGQPTVYTITVSNAGPASASGAVVTDPAVAGLSCSAVACSATTGGATCPAVVDIPTLQGGGLVMSNFPANSSASFSLTCTAQ